MTRRSEVQLPLSLFATWLARGERGLSSEAIVENLTGERIGRFGSGGSYPYDPSDLRRCLQLLEEVPLAKLAFPGTLAERSPVWAALIEIWDELEATFRAEQAEGTGRAPRTCALMHEAIERGRAA